MGGGGQIFIQKNSPLFERVTLSRKASRKSRNDKELKLREHLSVPLH